MKKPYRLTLTVDRVNAYAILTLLFLAIINLVILGIVIGLLSNTSKAPQKQTVQAVPEVTIKYPMENTTLSGEAHAALAFPPGFGFAKLDFSVDGQLVEEMTPTHPHELTFNFDTRSFGDGEHTLTFLATESGGTTSQAKVTITINNKLETIKSNF